MCKRIFCMKPETQFSCLRTYVLEKIEYSVFIMYIEGGCVVYHIFERYIEGGCGLRLVLLHWDSGTWPLSHYHLSCLLFFFSFVFLWDHVAAVGALSPARAMDADA